MSVIPIRTEVANRGRRMLRTALGASISAWLEDAAVIEVMLNPDGQLWVDRLGEGLIHTGQTLLPSDGERIIRLVAHHVGVDVHAKSPRVSAELPESGERFEGLLPPVASAPCFAIRKPAVAVFTLADYARAGIMTELGAKDPRSKMLRTHCRMPFSNAGAHVTNWRRYAIYAPGYSALA